MNGERDISTEGAVFKLVWIRSPQWIKKAGPPSEGWGEGHIHGGRSIQTCLDTEPAVDKKSGAPIRRMGRGTYPRRAQYSNLFGYGARSG